MPKIQYQCEGCGEIKEIYVTPKRPKKTNYCGKCHSKATQTGVRKPRGDSSYISSDGYKMIKINGEYTASGRQVYRREHVLVMEDHMGRKLKTQKGHNGEQVHHIDGDKLNNNIDNLLFCRDSKHHKDVDCQLHELAFELVRDEIITFNKDTEEYEIQWGRIK